MEKNNSKRRKKALAVCLVAVTICVTATLGNYAFFQTAPIISCFSNYPPSISAKQGILIKADSLEILYEKNAEEKAYPASTTKIMTALVTLNVLKENNSPLKQQVVVPKSACSIEGSSIYLREGEKISIEDLLYGLMLRSGNDAAMCLAEIIGGNTENFVEKMNETAAVIGCKGTNFENPSGLFEKEHYTTAYDMAIISAAAMKDPVFEAIAKAKDYTADKRDSDYVYFYNKNKVVHQYKGGIGIKIGYTKASGRTLVAAAERNGTKLICVVFNASDWFNDAYALLDYGFSLE